MNNSIQFHILCRPEVHYFCADAKRDPHGKPKIISLKQCFANMILCNHKSIWMDIAAVTYLTIKAFFVCWTIRTQRRWFDKRGQKPMNRWGWSTPTPNHETLVSQVFFVVMLRRTSVERQGLSLRIELPLLNTLHVCWLLGLQERETVWDESRKIPNTHAKTCVQKNEIRYSLSLLLDHLFTLSNTLAREKQALD